MSRALGRLNGNGSDGSFIGGNADTAERWTLTRGTVLRNNLDLLALGITCRNVLAGGDMLDGSNGNAAGDFDLRNWTPFVIDNSNLQISSFTDSVAAATLVVQCRFLLQVSDSAITITPKILYGSSITTITSVASVSGSAVCSATNADFSGSNQYQTLSVSLPTGVNLFKPQVTVGGTPADGLYYFARAWWDIYVQSS